MDSATAAPTKMTYSCSLQVIDSLPSPATCGCFCRAPALVLNVAPAFLQVDSAANQIIYASTAEDLETNGTRIPVSAFREVEFYSSTDKKPPQTSDTVALTYVNEIDGKLLVTLSSEDKAQELLEDLRDKLYISTVVYSVGVDGQFPESLIGVQPDTALCLSGGGIRAHVAGTGQLRALHHLGLMNKELINYLSSTSGGTWAATIYSFYEHGAADDDELLGLSTDPATLTLAELEKEPSPIAAVAKNSLLKEVRRKILSTSARELFHEAIGKQYLEPFGLNQNAYFTMEELVDVIKGNNPLLSSARFNVLKKDRPFWVCNASLLGPSWNHHISELLSLQFTALYCGTPYMHRIHYEERARWSVGRELDFDLGGAMIDPFAFQSNSSVEDDGDINPAAAVNKLYDYLESRLQHADSFLGVDRETFKESKILKRIVSIPKPGAPMTLKEVNSIVGFAFGLMFRKRFLLNRLVPSGNFWNPTSKEKDVILQYADGGMTDNLALLPMLQRKVKRNVVFFNGYIPLPPAGTEISFETFPSSNLLPLFGLHVDESVYGRFSQNQVFETEKLTELIEELNKKKAANQPLVVQMKLAVLPNSFWNIDGDWEVEILWFYLENCDAFVEKLPEDTREEISKGDKGRFKNFPTYDTFGQDHLTNEQINLLQSFTEWQVMQNADEVTSFLRGLD